MWKKRLEKDIGTIMREYGWEAANLTRRALSADPALLASVGPVAQRLIPTNERLRIIRTSVSIDWTRDKSASTSAAS